MYLWSVHDFKAYGVFAGWSVHEELTCLICGLDTYCLCLTHGSKISYFDCHRRWLCLKHKFRQEQNTLRKDTIVTKGPLKHLIGAQIIDMLDKPTPNSEKLSILKITERCTIRPINVYYWSFRT
jgi:hypothetical protein